MTAILKLRVSGMDSSSRAQELQALLSGNRRIERVDINEAKQLIRIAGNGIDIAALNAIVASRGFNFELPEGASETHALDVPIQGMTCHSCEILIEDAWKKVPNITAVNVSAAKGVARIRYTGEAPSHEALELAIGQSKYRVGGSSPAAVASRPKFSELIGLFAVVFLIGTLFSRLGLLKPAVNLGAASIGSVFLLGLFAASSSCLAVSGGLLLSSASAFTNRYGGGRMRPVVLFVVGRVAAYTVLGGAIGLLGSSFTLSPFATGAITLAAALYMLGSGLAMLKISPRWLTTLTPRLLPKMLSRRVMGGSESSHPLAPIFLGSGTFFLPCGFTQALQLYALTTGSAATSAMLLGVFALGTAPALLALGWASSSLKGKAGQLFFKLSGAAVILLGLWNIQNGMTILGRPLSLQWLIPSTIAAQPGINDSAVTFNGTEQIVHMKVGRNGYSPEGFTIRAGVPTTWVVNADDAVGCLTVLQAPKLGVRKVLQPGENRIAFTANDVGAVQFSCSMGMFRGQIRVVPNT